MAESASSRKIDSDGFALRYRKNLALAKISLKEKKV